MLGSSIFFYQIKNIIERDIASDDSDEYDGGDCFFISAEMDI